MWNITIGKTQLWEIPICGISLLGKPNYEKSKNVGRAHSKFEKVEIDKIWQKLKKCTPKKCHISTGKKFRDLWFFFNTS